MQVVRNAVCRTQNNEPSYIYSFTDRKPFWSLKNKHDCNLKGRKNYAIC
jgi:hypothetical protein